MRLRERITHMERLEGSKAASSKCPALFLLRSDRAEDEILGVELPDIGMTARKPGETFEQFETRCETLLRARGQSVPVLLVVRYKYDQDPPDNLNK